ncbi:MAG: zinc ribbon domain-containing protein [Oscillospiraceae bacterium]|nr:zinc ribbon domain-containing protein [Oscillospiraceae bacterium]
MNCPYCGAAVAGQTQYCPNCGTRLPDVPQDPPRPSQPLIGMILGIISCVLAFIAYLATIIAASSGHGVGTVILLLVIPALGLAVESLILSITGMKRSIRTGGRKYVKGIVFSAVGITCAATALLFVAITFFLGILLRTVTSRYYF